MLLAFYAAVCGICMMISICCIMEGDDFHAAIGAVTIIVMFFLLQPLYKQF